MGFTPYHSYTLDLTLSILANPEPDEEEESS